MSVNNLINNFVVRFANVNGTGSASANYLFAKAVFRMGIFATPKNIFPSNIQGLPTWYDVRVSEKGYLGRREGVDMMVSVNPQSMANDIKSVKTGGYFLYDSTKDLPAEALPIAFYEGSNNFVKDIRQKLLRFRKLSEKQIEAALNQMRREGIDVSVTPNKENQRTYSDLVRDMKDAFVDILNKRIENA